MSLSSRTNKHKRIKGHIKTLVILGLGLKPYCPFSQNLRLSPSCSTLISLIPRILLRANPGHQRSIRNKKRNNRTPKENPSWINNLKNSKNRRINQRVKQRRNMSSRISFSTKIHSFKSSTKSDPTRDWGPWSPEAGQVSTWYGQSTKSSLRMGLWSSPPKNNPSPSKAPTKYTLSPKTERKDTLEKFNRTSLETHTLFTWARMESTKSWRPRCFSQTKTAAISPGTSQLFLYSTGSPCSIWPKRTSNRKKVRSLCKICIEFPSTETKLYRCRPESLCIIKNWEDTFSTSTEGSTFPR